MSCFLFFLCFPSASNNSFSCVPSNSTALLHVVKKVNEPNEYCSLLFFLHSHTQTLSLSLDVQVIVHACICRLLLHIRIHNPKYYNKHVERKRKRVKMKKKNCGVHFATHFISHWFRICNLQSSNIRTTCSLSALNATKQKRYRMILCK